MSVILLFMGDDRSSVGLSMRSLSSNTSGFIVLIQMHHSLQEDLNTPL